jgi:hypothetical protein
VRWSNSTRSWRQRAPRPCSSSSGSCAARPALTLEVAGLLLYGSISVGALLLAPTAGLVVVAATVIAHGIWDLWHLRRHRDLVSPSLAEACVALDVPLGLAVLVAVLV